MSRPLRRWRVWRLLISFLDLFIGEWGGVSNMGQSASPAANFSFAKQMNEHYSSLSASARPFAAAIIRLHSADDAPEFTSALASVHTEPVHEAFAECLEKTLLATLELGERDLSRFYTLLRESKQAFEIVQRSGLQDAAYEALGVVNLAVGATGAGVPVGSLGTRAQ